METTESINLTEMKKEELMTLLQKRIFQLGMNGLQQNELTKEIEEIEAELKRRKEESISQANEVNAEEMPENATTVSAVEDGK